jgi:hypothetical protein
MKSQFILLFIFLLVCSSFEFFYTNSLGQIYSAFDVTIGDNNNIRNLNVTGNVTVEGSIQTKSNLAASGNISAENVYVENIIQFGAGPSLYVDSSSNMRTDNNVYINGNLFVSGTFRGTNIRTIYTNDERPGCPNPTTNGTTPLINQTFTLYTTSQVYVTASNIRFYSGRADLNLVLDGNVVATGISFTETVNWVSLSLSWAGQLAPGNHLLQQFPVQMPWSNGIGIWGCGSQYGWISTLIID